MKRIRFWGRAVAVAMALLLAGGIAFAQSQTGSLFGTVVDDGGTPLPGVTVTLSGAAGVPNVQVTDTLGRFRYPTLGPGSYNLKAELQGFSPVEYPNISINIARNTAIEITMNPAVEDVITVTTESPLLDERRISTGATVSQTELEKIPSARDPWAILQTTPGVLTDRINVGGNESGQQSQYVGPGSSGEQAIWAVDGVVITDMGALGSSPAYYDFDSLEEMQVTTGGSDATIATGGVVLNIVTKRGTNEWRGSGRYIVADDNWQAGTDFDENELARGGVWNGNGAGQAAFKNGNRIVSVEDYGAEIGGPIVRDRLWVWGSYALNEVDLLTVADVQDYSELETMNLKLNAQLTPSNSATASAIQSDKIKEGRNAGPTRTQPTTWNQSKFGDDPTGYKVEDTHIFSSSFYLTGLYSVVNGGFQLVPQGGMDVTPWRDNSRVWQNSYLLYQTPRPQEQYRADAASFFNTGNLSHELKYGAGFREAEVESRSRWAGAGFMLALGASAPNTQYILLAREALPASVTEYTSAYIQDTLSVGNLTVNAGLRYDQQGGENLARTVAANPLFPDLLPAVTYNGGDAGFEWETIVPRLGLTYALGAERKTLLRASYSRFADQLGSGTTAHANPLYPGSYIYGYVYNNNGRQPVRREDVVLTGTGSGNYDPRTGRLLTSYAVDPDLDAPITDEILFSVEHALRPEFVVGLNLTWRNYHDILEQERLVFDGDAFGEENLDRIGRLHRRDDYVLRTGPGTLPDGTPYTLRWYELRDGVSSRSGFFLENGDREQNYRGVSATFNKRLSNRWMARGNFSWQDWEWDSPESENEDPTITLPDLTGAGIPDGAPVLQGSGTGSGAKGNVFINSGWSYNVNAMYQVAPDRPWGFNVSGSFWGREGYPLIYFERFARATLADGAGLGTPVLIENVDSRRYDDIHMLDMRLEKEFTFNEVGLTLGVDVFNVFNEATVMQRQGLLHSFNFPNPDGTVTRRTNSTAGDFVQETTNPRIFRLGARFSFR
ncbi:MAG TPA: TonB-dependent receptor [Thermoanaerobaculia bacterium]|nr:TonB-dependent receptor [Thermoanaerobaculia bacterium]